MLTETEILHQLYEALLEYNLIEKGWRGEIVDIINLGDVDAAGYTDFENRKIQLSREFFPTIDENVDELIRHEVAHAFLGYGVHDEDWSQQLLDMGGTMVWISEKGHNLPFPVRPGESYVY